MTLDDLKLKFSAVATRRAIETGRPLGEVARALADELVLAMRIRTGRPAKVSAQLSDWGYVNSPTLDALRVFVAERIAGGGEVNDVNWAAAQEKLQSAKPGCRLAQVLPNDQLELLVARRWLCDHWLHGGDYGSINH